MIIKRTNIWCTANVEDPRFSVRMPENIMGENPNILKLKNNKKKNLESIKVFIGWISIPSH